jgi:hypothetical protein
MEFFHDILGHSAAKEVLGNAIAHPHHGYLIEGPSGVGCHVLAEAFVRALASHPPDRPLAAHPDIAVLAREWNDAGTALKKEIAVKEVRALRTRVSERPVIASRVTAYIPDADFLNEEGVNALLKSVEEPPAGAVFVLVAHRPGNLPATLLSRVQRLSLRRVASDEVRAWLVSGGVSSALADDAVAVADGRPGMARRFVDDEPYRVRVGDADRVVAAIARAAHPGAAFAAIASEASRCDSADDSVTEWRETLHLWGVALRRRIATDPPGVAAGIGQALIAAERHLGSPISPRIILELGLNRAASGMPPVFPGWIRGTYPFPI